MERKKLSKGSLWEFCYANKIFGTFGDEINACGQKLVKFCAHTHAAKLVVYRDECENSNAKYMYLSDVTRMRSWCPVSNSCCFSLK